MDSCKHLNGASFRPVYAVKSCAKLVTTRVNNTVTKSWRTIRVNPFPFVCVHLLQGLNDSAKECWGCLHGGMKILEGETCNFSLGLHAVILTFQQNYHNNQLVVRQQTKSVVGLYCRDMPFLFGSYVVLAGSSHWRQFAKCQDLPTSQLRKYYY